MSLDDALKSEEALLKERLRSVQAEQQQRRRAAEDAKLEPLRGLAARMHDLLCAWNHTDGCGWEYERVGGGHNWAAYSHDRWLRHVLRMIEGTDAFSRLARPVSREALESLLEHVAPMKAAHPDALYLLRCGMDPR